MKATIEINKNSNVKYEMNFDKGILEADRVLDIPYPENYGYINHTLAGDGDAADIFIISEELDRLKTVEFSSVGS